MEAIAHKAKNKKHQKLEKKKNTPDTCPAIGGGYTGRV